MLHEFVTTNRETIIARTGDRVRSRTCPPLSTRELDNGVPVFLTQLSETLRWDATTTPFSPTAIGSTAARHGRDLLAMGVNITQVVHNYGDICQVITDLALEQNAPIATEEFHILNRCLDTAIAEAVTEHARITAMKTETDEVERSGQSAHELRNLLNTALLAFRTVKDGAVSINGSTGMVLGRTLIELRDLVDRTLSEVRLDAGIQRRERLIVGEFLDDVAVTANLHAEYRDLHFSVVPPVANWPSTRTRSSSRRQS